MADVFLIAGPLGSGRVARIDGLLREAWGHAWLLVPTRQYASRRIERLLLESDLGGAWGRPVSTMEDFVVTLLRAEGLDPVRLDDFERRMLLKRVIERLESEGALELLGPAARTNGFATHILRTITQLKQAAIEPVVFAERIVRRQHAASIHGVVAAVYAGYQDALRDVGVYDLPGLFWEADLVAQAKCPAALDGIDTLLLDGFDDFTPSEFRLLASIEKHVARLVFGVDYDADPDRRDLFALPYRTIQALQKRFAMRTETYETDAPRTCIEFASRHFMHRGKPPASSDLVRDVGFWICSDFTQEMEAVARRVKTLLLEGVPADAIAVVYPDLRQAAPSVCMVFAEFGVPIRLIHPPALWSSAVSGFLLALLEALDAWNHNAVLDVLMSPWFLGGTSESDSFARLAAKAQVVAGRSEWFQGIERLLARIEAKKGDDIARLIDSVPNAEACLRLLQTRLVKLGSLADCAPERDPPAAWPAWLDAMIDELNIAETVERHPVKAIRDSERAALATLRDLLGRWAAWAMSDERPQTRADFVAALRHALQQTPFPAPGAGSGVAVLDLASLRGLQFDYVFLAGANEGDIPSPPPANAVYSEQDVSELAEHGVEIEGRRVHAEREALLFHRVFGAARKHLNISWRIYARGGKEQSPSPYADEVRALLEPVIGPPVARDRFVPDAGEVASWRDICNLANNGASAVKSVVARRFPRIEAGARIERARLDTTPFGAYDGVLNHIGIAERYGSNHIFSVAQLETYADCPFRFFVERILDIEESELPEAEFDPRVRGQIMHKALESLHRRYLGRAVSEWPEDELREAVRRSVSEAFEQLAWHSVTAPRGVMNVERERLCALLDRYLRIERERGEIEWKPSHLEVAFGGVRDSDDPISNAEPYLLHVNEQETVRFAGRIDRIDRCGNDARIIDYKSSLPSPDFKTGRSMQLAVYAMALEEFLAPGAVCSEAYFLPVGRKDRKEALGRNKKTDEWPARRAAVLETIARCVAGIREGRFPPTPADRKKVCQYCRNRRACRHETSRIERKEATP